MRLVGHYFTHSEEELRDIGVSERTLIQHFKTKLGPFRRDPFENTGLGPLWQLNPGRNDGLTLVLLRVVPRAIFEYLRLAPKPPDRLDREIRVSEPSNWELLLFGHHKLWTPNLRRNACKEPQPIALLAEGTFDTSLTFEQRVCYEIGATLALIAGGEWKRARRNKLLEFVPWSRVRQTLQAEGRGELARLLQAFFQSRKYVEEVHELVRKVAEQNWGFEPTWVFDERYASSEEIRLSKPQGE
jgi:hypothetical protein